VEENMKQLKLQLFKKAVIADGTFFIKNNAGVPSCGENKKIATVFDSVEDAESYHKKCTLGKSWKIVEI
jgi:hypothetical protein